MVRTTENTGKSVVLNEKCNWPKLPREILKRSEEEKREGKTTSHSNAIVLWKLTCGKGIGVLDRTATKLGDLMRYTLTGKV